MISYRPKPTLSSKERRDAMQCAQVRLRSAEIALDNGDIETADWLMERAEDIASDAGINLEYR